MNEFVSFQGCRSIYMGMTKDLDLPGLLFTVGTIKPIKIITKISFPRSLLIQKPFESQVSNKITEKSSLLFHQAR